MTVQELPLETKFKFICAMMQCVNEWRRNYGDGDDDYDGDVSVEQNFNDETPYNEAHGMKEALAMLYDGEAVHDRFCHFFAEFSNMMYHGDPSYCDNDVLRYYLVRAFGISEEEFKKYNLFEKEEEVCY